MIRKLCIILSMASLATIGFITVPISAHASGAALCDADNGNLCLNRNGGGTGNGTEVISWYNDSNSDFTPIQITSQCNHGAVTLTCPFSNHAIDRRYYTDSIVELYSSGSGKCVAMLGDMGSYLEGCGNTGYVFILSAQNYLVNLYWTNEGFCTGDEGPAWLIADGLANQEEISCIADNAWTW